MATNRRKPVNTAPDPAQVANQAVLRRREQLIQKQQEAAAVPDVDLGLKLQDPGPEAESAEGFLRDEWDKKAFGEAPRTTTRVVYGPDPLLTASPALHEMLQQVGREAYAEATAQAIMQKGEMALPDPVMRKAMKGAIAKFGRENVAKAFAERILQIKERTVEIEVGEGLDPLLSNPLAEAVARYGTPGMAPKFLSERCIQVLGLRGYRIVKDENGDPVKVGTLTMGEIPQEMADRRRAHFAQMSTDEVQAQEEAFMEATDRMAAAAGRAGIEARPLHARETISAGATESEEFLGRDFEMGVHIRRNNAA